MKTKLICSYKRRREKKEKRHRKIQENTISYIRKRLEVGESIRNDVDYTSYVLGGVLFLWRLSIASLLVVSLSYSFFCSISSSVCVVIPMLILLVFTETCHYFNFTFIDIVHSIVNFDYDFIMLPGAPDIHFYFHT